MPTQQLIIPPLETGWCNSWVVSRKVGKAIGEFWDRSIVERFSGEAYIVETTLQYLGRINEEISRGNNRSGVFSGVGGN